MIIRQRTIDCRNLYFRITAKKHNNMQTVDFIPKKPCSCCKRKLPRLTAKVNEIGLWYDCPDCKSTGLYVPPKYELKMILNGKITAD